nr:hypothetical protein [Tanacetum cinerariifolium]
MRVSCSCRGWQEVGMVLQGIRREERRRTMNKVRAMKIVFENLEAEVDHNAIDLKSEVRAMKTVFENLEDEVDQNAIDLKSGKIERKNLLITNENLIANCIAQDVFFTITDSAMTASRFHELSTAYTVAMNRAVELNKRDDQVQVHKNTIRDDLIACLNKAMAFLIAVASSRFPSTNNQLRTSSNTRNQATIQDSRARVVKCYNCQGEGHMARQCTQPKRQRNVAWSKEKAMLAEAQEAGQILDEEQLAFLADPGILAAVLMANISNYCSDVISEVPNFDNYLNDMDSQKQMINHVNNWENANKEQNQESITAELERYKERVKTFEQRLNIDLSSRKKMIDSQMDDMIKEKLALKEKGKQSLFDAGTFRTRANISKIARNNSGQQRVVKYFNCQGEGHMARQCPKPKRKRDATWFRDKVLLVEAQGSTQANGKVLNEEELEFLEDPGVAEGPVT